MTTPVESVTQDLADLSVESGTEWVDINITKYMTQEFDVERAIFEIYANAADANRESNAGDPEIEWKIDSVTISDKGVGLSMDAFTCGAPSEKKRGKEDMGIHHMGLKDAIAIVFRKNYKIEFHTGGNIIRFEERLTVKGVTIHFSFQKVEELAGVKGTRCIIRGANIFDYKRKFEDKYLLPDFPPIRKVSRELLTGLHVRSLNVYKPTSSPVSYVYINNIKVDTTFEFYFIYSFGTDKTLTTRDHQVMNEKNLIRLIRSFFSRKVGLLQFLSVMEHLPRKRIYEFVGVEPVKYFPDEDPPPVYHSFSQGNASNVRVASSIAHSPVAYSSPVSSTPLQPSLYVLHDYENCPNALESLAAIAKEKNTLQLYVFSSKSKEDSIKKDISNITNVSVVYNLEDTREAADTNLVFQAGVLAPPTSTGIPSKHFVIVCGAEERYSELERRLESNGHKATIVRYTDENDAAFLGKVRTSL